jgi:hypothetical protein
MSEAYPGDLNPNGQRLIAKADPLGADSTQDAWIVECTQVACRHRYYVNETDFFQQKCPRCQPARESPAIDGVGNAKMPKKAWFVSFDPDPKRRRIRSAQSFASEIEAKRFAREAVSSGKVVYAGAINPHEPRRFIPPEKMDEWLNEH